MTSTIWPRTCLAAFALVCGACQHPTEPPAAAPAPATQPPPTPPTPPTTTDPGELRAEAAGVQMIGTPGPALTLTTIDGDTIDLAKLYGQKPVYLKFWATWCTPCREQMPGFERLYETVGDRMQVIAVNAGLDDDVAAVRAFRADHGLHMPIVIDDGRLAAALDLQVTPQHVLIGRDARIAYVGHVDSDHLATAIHKALSEPGPAGPATGRTLPPRPALHPGDLVQDVTARTIDGATVSLGASPDGKPRAIVLFTAWCESYLETRQPRTAQACRRVRETVDRLATAGEVEWLGIAGGLWTAPEEVAEYKTQNSIRFPLVLDADGALFRAFGVHRLPTIALLDRHGRLVRLLGPDDPDLAQAVHALAASK